jgi:hypothetical protein
MKDKIHFNKKQAEEAMDILITLVETSYNIFMEQSIVP